MKYLFFLIFVASIVACTPKTAEIITPIETENNETANDQGMPKHPIGEGKMVYLNKCSNCHYGKKIEDYTANQWEKILPQMIENANLNEEEATNVRAYIEWELTND